MRRLFMLSCVAMFLSGGSAKVYSSEAKEPLNILGLTLSMIIDELYNTLEENKDLLEKLDSLSSEKSENGRIYFYHLTSDERNQIATLAVGLNQVKRRITWVEIFV